jgi:hypothetical protein
VTTSGPIFHADSLVEKMQADIATDIAQRGFELWQANLSGSLRHPTGYYQSQIQVVDHPDGKAVNDNGIVYGPWLEGVGSRNRSTRFKGYFSLRRAMETLQSEATDIAQKSVDEFIAAVN